MKKPAKLLTLTQAAARIDREPRTMRGYIAAGLLTPITVDGLARFSPADVDALPAKLGKRGRPKKYD